MSGKTVKRTVHVFNPETGDSEVLSPGMKIPAYATDQVTNPKVFEEPANAEEAVNNDVSVTVQEGTQGVDGSDVTAADNSGSTDEDLGEVNETPNANPAQRQTAGEPGGNQAAKVGEVAVADQPFVDPAADPAADAPAAKKTAAKRAPAAKTAAKKG